MSGLPAFDSVKVCPKCEYRPNGAPGQVVFEGVETLTRYWKDGVVTTWTSLP